MWGRIHLLGVVVIALALSLALPAAGFAHMTQSVNVALVPDDGSASSGGILPTSGTVTGADGDSFDQFSFTEVPLDSLNAATLAQYDTVVLMQVSTGDLGPSAEQALSQFVTNGGKLIIHDADSTAGNDYSWLPVPAQTGQSCQNCGDTSGTSQVIENNTLVSANPGDPSYVNVSELEGNTDAVGDANVMVTQDPRWFVDIRATNSLGQTGAVDTYASDNGLIIFNGYDTDALGSTQDSGADWLAKLWYQELAQGWDPDGLPHGTPVAPPPPPPNPCTKAFPRAHVTDIGRTSIHNYQSSVRMVDCYQFGVRHGKFQIHPTAAMLCGMIASATGWVGTKAGVVWRAPNLDKLGPATDGACSAGEVLGSDSTAEKAASLACSWSADLLGGKTPSPGFFAGLGCSLAPVVGNALGNWWETNHEHSVAQAVTRHGKCIKYSPRHFPSPWLDVDCARGDRLFG
jgi:hypothetical protein